MILFALNLAPSADFLSFFALPIIYVRIGKKVEGLNRERGGRKPESAVFSAVKSPSFLLKRRG